MINSLLLLLLRDPGEYGAEVVAKVPANPEAWRAGVLAPPLIDRLQRHGEQVRKLLGGKERWGRRLLLGNACRPPSGRGDGHAAPPSMMLSPGVIDVCLLEHLGLPALLLSCVRPPGNWLGLAA